MFVFFGDLSFLSPIKFFIQSFISAYWLLGMAYKKIPAQGISCFWGIAHTHCFAMLALGRILYE